MAVIPGHQRAHDATRASAQVSTHTRPSSPPRAAARRMHAAWHWLWAAVALAVGHFIAGAGTIAWFAGPALTVVALMGLVARHRWAHSALWIGLGLTLGVVLAAVLGIVQDDGKLAMAGFGG